MSQIIPGLGKLFGAGASSVLNSAKDILDEVITNKEELAEAKHRLEVEANRHAEAQVNAANELAKAYLADMDSARNREIETTRAGSANVVQSSLAIISVAFFCLLVAYCVVRGFGDGMSENEALLVGSLLGVSGANSATVMNYYFGSSAGSASKDITIKKLQK